MSTAYVVSADDNVRRETRTFSILGKDTLMLDAYYDTTVTVKPEGRPVIVYVHGGGFVTGSRINAAQEIFCRHLAEKGWLAVAVDYRLAGIRQNADGSLHNPYHVDGTLSAVRMACSDVINATNYILGRCEWKANAKQVCLAGGSAGAITCLQIVYDRCNDIEYTKALPDSFEYAGVISQAGCICAPITQDTLQWRRKPCPIMFFHGSNDQIVPIERGNADCNFFGTLYITRQLKPMGLPYWKWIENGADHVMAMKPLTTYLGEQMRFLDDFCLGGLQSVVNTDVTDKEPTSMASVDLMLKYVPMYILGYGKYLEQMGNANDTKPKSIVY